jgi:hypothetical protein
MRSPSPYTPFALTGRYALHPARQVTNFLGLLALNYNRSGHAQQLKGLFF